MQSLGFWVRGRQLLHHIFKRWGQLVRIWWKHKLRFSVWLLLKIYLWLESLHYLLSPNQFIIATSIKRVRWISFIQERVIGWKNYYLITRRIMSKQEKQNFIAHEKFCGGKIVSPHEMLSLLKKNEHNRMWILKQLSQLGIDINLLEDYSLSDLYRHCDQIIKSTYSIKYLGMNENEMGIISRRIDPFKDNNFNLKSLAQSKYTVNKFFFPKPLKVGRKCKKEEVINIDNLESEIKKAFLKNNPVNPRAKSKNKVMVNGSWLSYRIKDKQFVQSKKSKSQSFLRSTAEKDGIKIPHMTCVKKLANSYSRFLSSGLVSSANCYDQHKI